DLLDAMEIPHAPQGTVSLVQRQISSLRDKNHELTRKLLDLVAIARENEKLSSQLHDFSLALIEADSLDDVLAVSRNQLIEAFKADFVKIGLFGMKDPNDVHASSDEDANTLFGSLIKAKRNFCGSLADEQNEYLFGEHASEVESVAFVPLYTTRVLGFLAMGSRDIAKFHQGMGTLFLGQLGELVTHAIVHHQNFSDDAKR
ncbi:MAG TPA: DUF484 family protein, partial [Candidatus Tenderia sp.]|nr:DUF484 family protein [Candidatus Tenderia sp.]